MSNDLLTAFEASGVRYLKNAHFAEDGEFHDAPIKFVGWKKVANDGEDWKDKIKYQLQYSYPEKFTHEGEEKTNRNWDPDFPQGYEVHYEFDEGVLSSGSWPLFRAFRESRVVTGDIIQISRTGSGVDTTWQVRKVRNLPTPPAQPDLADDKIPF